MSFDPPSDKCMTSKITFENALIEAAVFEEFWQEPKFSTFSCKILYCISQRRLNEANIAVDIFITWSRFNDKMFGIPARYERSCSCCLSHFLFRILLAYFRCETWWEKLLRNAYLNSKVKYKHFNFISSNKMKDKLHDLIHT